MVTTFLLAEGLSSCRTAQRYMSHCHEFLLRRNWDSYFLTVFSLFLYFLTPLLSNWLSLFFGASGRRLKPVSTNKEHREAFSPRRAPHGPAPLQSPAPTFFFFWILLHPERNRGQDRKEHKVLDREDNHNWTGEVGFRGAWFQYLGYTWGCVFSHCSGLDLVEVLTRSSRTLVI